MSRKKKLSAVLFAVLLCLVFVFALAACTPQAPPKTHNEEVEPYFNELGAAFANSISADLANGFYIGLSGAVSVGQENYGFDLEGNVLSKAKEGSATANTDFRFVIKKNDVTQFGVYNDETNLYLEVGENKYNFSNASVMKALRSFLVLNVPGYSDLTNLEDVSINDSSLKTLVGEALPLALKMLTVNPAVEDKTADLAMNKVDSTYTFTIFMSNLDSLGLGDVDLSFLKGLVINLSVTVENERVKGVDVSLKVDEVDYKVNLQAKTAGIFAPVNDEFDAAVPAELKAVEASSVLQTDFAGKINLQNTAGTGTTVIRSFDWKLVSKLDLIDLIDKNFMLSKLAEGNFFHFQLSHTCNEDCTAYCAQNLLAAQSRIVNDRFTETSIIDIAWDPATMETDNLVADISLWDLVTTNTVVTLVNKLMPTMTGVEALIPMVVELIPSQVAVAVNIDNIAQGVTDQTVARTTVASASSPSAAEGAAASLDINQIVSTIQDIFGVIKTGNQSLTIDLAGLSNVLNNLVPGDLVAGLKIGDIVSAVFDSKSGVNAIEANISKNNFGHNAVVSGYNTYEEAVKYNIGKVVGSEQRVLKMKSKLIEGHAVSAYGNISGATYTEGAPLLYFKSVEAVEGYINLYYKDSNSSGANVDGYIVASSKDIVLDNYQLERVYGGLKNLYFKYTYLDFNKEEQTAYSPVLGFKDFNLNTDGAQEVTLLTGLLMGVGFNTALVENISGLSALVPDLAIPNLETLIPSASNWDTVGKINFTNKVQPDAGSVKFTKQNDKTEIKVDGTIDTEAKFEYTVNGRSYTADAKGSLDLKYDQFGYLIPGEYTITYTAPDYLYYEFEGGTNVLTETITVLAPQSTEVRVTEQTLEFYTRQKYDVGQTTLGHVAYTYEDGSVQRDLIWNRDFRAFNITKDENPSTDPDNPDISSINAGELTIANSGAYSMSLVFSGTTYTIRINALSVTKAEAVAAETHNIHYGDMTSYNGLGAIGTVTFTYDNDTTSEPEAVYITDYTRKFRVYKSSNQSTEGIDISGITGMILPEAGSYTFEFDHASGLTFKIELEVSKKVVSVYTAGELTSRIAGTTAAFKGMPNVFSTKTTTTDDDPNSATVQQFDLKSNYMLFKFYLNGNDVTSQVKVDYDIFNANDVPKFTFSEAGVYEVKATNRLSTGGKELSFGSITVYKPVSTTDDVADLSNTEFKVGVAVDFTDLNGNSSPADDIIINKNIVYPDEVNDELGSTVKETWIDAFESGTLQIYSANTYAPISSDDATIEMSYISFQRSVYTFKKAGSYFVLYGSNMIFFTVTE